MPRFGLVGPTYEAQSPNFDAQRVMNFYPEVDESGAGNSPIALLSSPGTKQFVLLTAAPTPPPCGPTALIFPFVGSNATLGNLSMTITLQAVPIAGPLVMLLPISCGVVFNVYCFVSGVTDSVGGAWQTLQPPTAWMISTNSPGDVVSYQLFGVSLAGGLPANAQIFVNFNVGLTGIKFSGGLIVLTNCVSFDQVSFFQTTGPGAGGGTIAGATVTTAHSDILLSLSNVTDVADPNYAVPLGTTQYFNDGTAIGLAGAIYAPGLFGNIPTQPPSTYNPAWGTNSPTLKQMILNTVAVRTC